MHLKLLPIVILFALLMGSCSSQEAKKHDPPPVKVAAAKVDRGDIDLPLILTGNLTYNADARLSARVAAQVTSLHVRDGQVVKKDQLLLSLDESEIQDTANAAMEDLKKHQARCDFLKTEWDKNVGLFKTGAISQIQYDQKHSAYRNALAQVDADKALLAKAKQDLIWTKVKSPITGVLSVRYVDIGDWVAKGKKLFQISDFDPIYLKAFLADRDVARLRFKEACPEAIETDVTVDAYPEKTFKGRITYVGPAADRGGVFEVRAYMDNPKMLLREGMFARARVVPERLKGVLRIPLTALTDKVRPNEDNTVFVVEKDSRVRLRRIQIGANDARYVQVRKGLKQGDIVVVYGKEILSTGVRVELTDMVRPKAP
jgi:membrane fusion protein (multidrug efflux system)